MRPVVWAQDRARLIDQTLLPTREVWVECTTPQEMARAIKSMQVRGAPAIGISAAYGMALAALQGAHLPVDELKASLEEARQILAASRPTAVNLFWALEEMAKVWQRLDESAEIVPALVERALEIAREDEEMCRQIGAHGAQLVPAGSRILTHCNAGALATGDYGTALGVVRAAHAQGKVSLVWVDETRPFLQGARLTAWELLQEGIPARLICDNMAGHFMQRGQIDLAVVGADRITNKGDVANKIGTYTVATLCKAHQIPFYVAAPYSTIDTSLQDGSQIPIEERVAQELTVLNGQRLAPEGIEVANPAFDVTPSNLVTAIITERGVFYPPFDFSKVLGS